MEDPKTRDAWAFGSSAGGGKGNAGPVHLFRQGPLHAMHLYPCAEPTHACTHTPGRGSVTGSQMKDLITSSITW